MNYKGGVGKTTLTANIGAQLANEGKRVLLLDLDPQANLTLSFLSFDEWRNFDREERTIKHWYDEFLDNNLNSPFKELIISPNEVNLQLMNDYDSQGYLDLICSHLELINVDMELSSRLGGSTERSIRSNYLRVLSLLRKNLEDLRNEYDVILIDCPPNFNLVTQNAIVASDHYIVPAKADYLSTLGINTLIRHIEELKKNYNHYLSQAERFDLEEIAPRMLGVIFTMVSYYGLQPISIHRDYIAQIRGDHPTFNYYLRENKTLYAQAPELGVPVVLQNVSKDQDIVIRELKELVEEIKTRIKVAGG